MAVERLDVLLVDDNVDVASGVADLLRRCHDVRVAGGLREAIAEVSQQVPDVVISDFDMPPYQGDALLQLIAVEHPRVRRILYTGSSPHNHHELIELNVAHAVLVKPCSLAELLEAIEPAEEAPTNPDHLRHMRNR